jgi:hypothetical protein
MCRRCGLGRLRNRFSWCAVLLGGGRGDGPTAARRLGHARRGESGGGDWAELQVTPAGRCPLPSPSRHRRTSRPARSTFPGISSAPGRGRHNVYEEASPRDCSSPRSRPGACRPRRRARRRKPVQHRGDRGSVGARPAAAPRVLICRRVRPTPRRGHRALPGT